MQPPAGAGRNLRNAEMIENAREKSGADLNILLNLHTVEVMKTEHELSAENKLLNH